MLTVHFWALVVWAFTEGAVDTEKIGVYTREETCHAAAQVVTQVDNPGVFMVAACVPVEG